MIDQLPRGIYSTGFLNEEEGIFLKETSDEHACLQGFLLFSIKLTFIL